jgi:hypothetical protein
MANDTPTPTKKTPLYQQGHRRYCSATMNLPLDARWFAQTLRDMPKTGFVVWHSLSEFTGHQNTVDARLHTIAEFCGLSLGPVQRAMRLFEEQGLIVRLSEKHKASVWLVNPELRWNGLHEQQPIMVARFKQRCRELKQQKLAEKKAQLNKNPVTIQIEDDEWIETESLYENQNRGEYHQGAGD